MNLSEYPVTLTILSKTGEWASEMASEMVDYRGN